jgi:YbbR domain-containing protein
MMAHLTQNLGIKLLSLGFAFVLFLYVHKQQASEATFFVPLSIQNDPNTRVIDDSSLRRTVTVTLSGPAERLKEIEPLAKAVANLAGQGSGSFYAPVEVKIPPEARKEVDVNWQPRVVNIRLEGRASRRLPVQVTFNVQPPAGLSLSKTHITPETATINGWESEVRRVRHLQAVVNSLGPGSAIDLVVAVRAVDSHGAEVGEEIQVQPPTIKVMAQLQRSIWSKPVYVSPVLGETPPSVRLRRVSVSPTRLTLQGPEAAVGAVQFLETEPIPLPDTPGVVDREARIVVPPGVRIEEPPRVRVVIALQGVSP